MILKRNGINPILFLLLIFAGGCSEEKIEEKLVEDSSFKSFSVVQNDNQQQKIDNLIQNSSSNNNPPIIATPPEMSIEEKPVTPVELSAEVPQIDTEVPESGSTDSEVIEKSKPEMPGASVQTNILLSELPDLVLNSSDAISKSNSAVSNRVQQTLVTINSVASLDKLERLFEDLKTETVPDLALQRIAAFTAFFDLTDIQKQQIELEQQKWQGRAAEDLIKAGEHFIPKIQVDEVQQELIQYLNAVIQSCEARESIDKILPLLERASRENSDSIVAYYHSGLIRANWLNDNKAAIADFRRVLSVIPDHSGTLNNMAICEMKSANYSKALGSWRKAMEGAQNLVNRNHILHNVAYAHAISQTSSINMPASFTRSVERLLSDYPEEITTNKDTRSPHWKFSPWIAKPTQVAACREYIELHEIPVSSLRVVQRIEGIAIGEGYVLTTTKGIELPYLGEAIQLRVVSGDLKSETSHANAEVIAFNREMGLTLLHCPELSTPALRFANKDSQTTESIYFSRRSENNNAEFHPIVNEDHQNTPDYAIGFRLNDRIYPPEGASIFDENGQLVGIVSSDAFSSAENEVFYGWNITSIKKFLKAAGVDETAFIDKPLREESWDSKKLYLTNHLVQIELCFPEESLSLEMASPSKYNRSHFLNNHSCFVCDGFSKVACDRKDCANGQISQKVRVVVGRTQMGVPIYGTNVVTNRCSRCSGRGSLGCPNCNDGTFSRF
ncbi:hypothetical protein [Rubinisphaera sp.]|uniref:hypothetical protein n=1 Tax=Rubinisphaera sp. TaxID=2024857 RepID=UPI000C0CB045|nr:hypothetical protein [Rubinisphaera sp.]MBV08296.1 hypothetical protein [Rubinisphaera sp.]HCS51622.1 hypothetical protein [Planctomycetaceae bacterium]